MTTLTPTDIRKALRKAKSQYDKGLRHYDEKHHTYNPATRVDNILSHVNELIGYHGLEAYQPGDSNPSHPRYSYLNSADTYRITLVYDDDKSKFLITDIGTIIENEESEEL